MLWKILKNKPYLAWDVKNKKALSDTSALEHILAYGNWEDVCQAKKILGLSKMRSLFEKMISKKRVNLKPRTINYFNNYFEKYA